MLPLHLPHINFKDGLRPHQQMALLKCGRDQLQATHVYVSICLLHKASSKRQNINQHHFCLLLYVDM